MDRALRKVGLTGKSFIPMIMGLGIVRIGVTVLIIVKQIKNLKKGIVAADINQCFGCNGHCDTEE